MMAIGGEDVSTEIFVCAVRDQIFDLFLFFLAFLVFFVAGFEANATSSSSAFNEQCT